jgi:hypothetical protein
MNWPDRSRPTSYLRPNRFFVRVVVVVPLVRPASCVVGELVEGIVEALLGAQQRVSVAVECEADRRMPGSSRHFVRIGANGDRRATAVRRRSCGRRCAKPALRTAGAQKRRRQTLS